MNTELKLNALVAAHARLDTLRYMAVVDEDYDAVKTLNEMLETIESWLKNVE